MPRWTPVVELPVELVSAIERQCPSAKKSRHLRDRLLYLVSLMTDPMSAREEDNYRVHLWSQLLKDCVGRHGGLNYVSLLDELVDAGLVWRGDEWSNAKTRRSHARRRQPGKCREFACRWPWQGAHRAVYVLGTMSLTWSRPGLDAALSGKDPALKYLAHCWQRSGLDVYHGLRLLCVEQGLPIDLARGDLGPQHYSHLSRALQGNERGQAALKSLWAGWVKPSRGQGEVWFSRDQTAGRLHSPVTNLASYLRPALRIDGSDRLVSLDLKCSQPTIAAAWMIEEGLHLTPGGRDWLAVVEHLDIYCETFKACHGRYPSKAERDEWKRTLFREWWYARAQVQANGDVGLALGARWREVHGWILARKSREEGGHASFPIELQAREASIFIDALALRLEAAGIVALTVHDSLIVREEDAAQAEELMRDALAVLGVRVQIERTDYFSASGLAVAA